MLWQASQDKERFETETAAYNHPDAVAAREKEAAEPKKKKKKKEREAGQPKGAKTAYIIFSTANREAVKTDNPDAKLPELSALLGEKWKALGEEEKKSYEEKAAQDKERYNKEMEAWNQPEAVEARRVAREKEQAEKEDKEALEAAAKAAKKAAKKSATKKKKPEPIKASNIQGSGMITCKCGESYREGWAWAHTCKEASKTANKTPARSFDDMRKEFDKIENKDMDSPPADIASPPGDDAQPEVVAGA